MSQLSGLSCAKSKGFRGLRICALRVGARERAIARLRTPSSPAFVGGCGICAKTCSGTHPSG
eukprot:5301339-Alexandrium_andersonii.AAC.1